MYLFIFYFWLCWVFVAVARVLVPRPGIEPASPALEARVVLFFFFLLFIELPRSFLFKKENFYFVLGYSREGGFLTSGPPGKSPA